MEKLKKPGPAMQTGSPSSPVVPYEWVKSHPAHPAQVTLAQLLLDCAAVVSICEPCPAELSQWAQL
jgi:hypothetical protein